MIEDKFSLANLKIGSIFRPQFRTASNTYKREKTLRNPVHDLMGNFDECYLEKNNSLFVTKYAILMRYFYVDGINLWSIAFLKLKQMDHFMSIPPCLFFFLFDLKSKTRGFD